MKGKPTTGILAAAVICLVGIPASPAFAQTNQQLRTCQGKTTDNVDAIIRACSAFIDTRRAVGGRPIPKMVLLGALQLRGNAYTKKGELDRGIVDYSEAIRLDAGKFQYEFFYNRGNNYLSKGEPDRAIADYDEAIRLNPKFAQAYSNRGTAHARKGDHVRANVDYDYALRLDSSPEARRRIEGARIAMNLYERWQHYLQTIQDEDDHVNWSGPPVQAFREAK
jgi:tetratricopeptide (TPR) repeat protein